MTEQPEAASTTAEQPPLLKVVNSNATPEEIAAIVAVFSALGSGAAAAPRKPRSLWGAPQAVTAPAHGPGAWRASGLPH